MLVPIAKSSEQLHEAWVTAQGLEEGVSLVPWITGEPRNRCAFKPGETSVLVAQLHQSSANAVGHVMIQPRTAQNVGDACARCVSHAESGFDGCE